jgi:hypothetical protein
VVEVTPRCKDKLASVAASAVRNARSLNTKDYRHFSLMCMRIFMLPGSEIPGLPKKLITQYLVDILSGFRELLHIIVHERKDYAQAARQVASLKMCKTISLIYL